MADRILYLDADLTLFHKKLLRPEQVALDDPSVFFDLFGYVQVKARPGAQAFIDHFRGMGVTVYCVTGGGTDSQTEALRCAGLSVDRLFGSCRGGVELPPPPAHWVLVDDSPLKDAMLFDKIARILGKLNLEPNDAELERALAEHFVQCEMFFDFCECKPLSELIPIIMTKLELA
jgi:hypothetical protein